MNLPEICFNIMRQSESFPMRWRVFLELPLEMCFLSDDYYVMKSRNSAHWFYKPFDCLEEGNKK